MPARPPALGMNRLPRAEGCRYTLRVVCKRWAAAPMIRAAVSIALLLAFQRCVLALGAAGAETPVAAPAPAGETQRSLLPNTLKLPDLSDIKLPMPRSVRAANALLGVARQRLALVVGNGKVDPQFVLAAAPRDTQAVAAALRAGGFVVMVREDLNAADLRANLKEFQQRLQPGGVGFLYYTGLGAQVDGQNMVLPRGTRLDGDLKSSAVPLQELVDAVQGTAESPRYLVVDAAHAHPALAMPGLAEQKMPPGTMALFAAAPGAVAPTAEAPPALPNPVPADPRRIAASPFGRELVRSLVTPRISGPELLRVTRAATVGASQGAQTPWIGGDSNDKDELAEPNLLDALFPQSPEDLAREGLKQLTRLATARSAGEQPVGEVLQQPAPSAPSVSAAPTTPTTPALETKDESPPTSRGVTETRQSLPNAPLAAPAAAAAAAAAAAGALADVAVAAATSAATLAAGAKIAEATATASAAASVANTALGVAGSVASVLASSSGNSGNPPASRSPASTPAAAGAPTPASTAAQLAGAPPPSALPAASPLTAIPPARAAVPPNFGPMDVAQFANPLAKAPSRPADERTQPQQGGGERPAYAPRVNPYGYAEGDTFTYRIWDTWKNRIIGSTVQAIEQVLDDGEMLANGNQTQMDAQGRIKSTRNPDGGHSEFEPYQDLWWSNPKRGESRDVKFNEHYQRADRSHGQTEWKGSLSVGRPRKIQLPAGEFDVLPIEGSGWYYQQAASGDPLVSGQWSRTVWYSPKLGHPVAIDVEDANALGKLLRRERIELLHAQTSRAAP